ncbi:hypothetical protein F5Y16DRAFT_316220 [Xylariaceae sp. FL0255]|nr:hypothetical protein F5Y16DRAFT_316220 [Xylariaceae sp. FL0255]
MPPNWSMGDSYADERRKSSDGYHRYDTYKPAERDTRDRNRDRDRDRDHDRDRDRDYTSSTFRRDSRDFRENNRPQEPRSPQESRQPRDRRDGDSRKSLELNTTLPPKPPHPPDKSFSNSPASARSGATIAFPRVSPREAIGLDSHIGDVNSTVSKSVVIPKAKDPALQTLFETIYIWVQKNSDRMVLRIHKAKIEQEVKKRQSECEKMKSKASIHGPYQDVSMRPTPREKKLQKEIEAMDEECNKALEQLVSNLFQIVKSSERPSVPAANSQPTQSMESIDKIVKLAEEQAKQIQSLLAANKKTSNDFESLNTRLETIETEQTDLKNEVQTLNSEKAAFKLLIEDLESERTTLKNDVQGLKSENAALKLEIQDCGSDYTTIRDGLESEQAMLRLSIQGLESERTAMQEELDGFNMTVTRCVNTLQTETKELKEKLPTEIGKLREDNKEWRAKVETESEELREKVDDLDHSVLAEVCLGWYEQDHNSRTMLEEHRKYRCAGHSSIAEALPNLVERVQELEQEVASLDKAQKDTTAAANTPLPNNQSSFVGSEGTSLERQLQQRIDAAIEAALPAIESSIRQKNKDHFAQSEDLLGSLVDDANKRTDAVACRTDELEKKHQDIVVVQKELWAEVSKANAAAHESCMPVDIENKLSPVWSQVNHLHTQVNEIQEAIRRLDHWCKTLDSYYSNISTRSLAEQIIRQVTPNYTAIERTLEAHNKSIAQHNDLLRRIPPQEVTLNPEERSKKRKLESNGRAVSSPLQPHHLNLPPS